VRLANKPFPLEHLSPTSLSLYASCPESWRQRYLLEREDVQFGDRFMGSVNHRTIEAVLLDKREGAVDFNGAGETPTEYVRTIYRDAWQRKLDEEGEPDWRDVDPTEQYAIGLLMALLYVEKAVPQINPVAIEEHIEVKLPRVPRIVGRVDVIESTLMRERKTTNQKVTKPKTTWRFQARVYQLITGMPLQWDVLTRQVTPQLFMADEYPDLRMENVSRVNTEILIRDLFWSMNDNFQRRGRFMPWPMEGFYEPWFCNYGCPIGPKAGNTCGAWH
jgi:hypothetical protein